MEGRKKSGEHYSPTAIEKVVEELRSKTLPLKDLKKIYDENIGKFCICGQEVGKEYRNETGPQKHGIIASYQQFGKILALKGFISFKRGITRYYRLLDSTHVCSVCGLKCKNYAQSSKTKKL